MKKFKKSCGIFLLFLFFLLIIFSDLFSQTISISPDTVYFGRIPEGTVALRELSIYNTGIDPLNVTAIHFEGQNAFLFSLIEDPGSFTLNIAQSKVLSIQFQPDRDGPVSARLIIQSNASTSPDAVPLTGEGTGLNAGFISFERIVGGSRADHGYSVYGTTDGGFILAGSTVRLEDDDRYGDALLVTTDAYGQIKWSHWYGLDTWSESFSKAIPTVDSGYIAVGKHTYSDRSKKPDVYAVKVDATGNVVWEKSYGISSSKADRGSDIIATSDGGFLIAGNATVVNESTTPPTESLAAYLIKIDSLGNVQWEKTYGGEQGEEAVCVKSTNDGGYIFAGSTSSYSTLGGSDFDFYLVKIDGSGNLEWQKSFGGTDWDRANSVIVTEDGGYLMAGFTASSELGAISRDVFLVKTDAAGKEEWHRLYGGDHSDEASEIISTNDGGYLIVGKSATYFDTGLQNWCSDAYVIKIDALGDVQWERTFGGLYDDNASSVRQVSDGGYIICGSTKSYSKDWDVYLLKLNSFGLFTSVKNNNKSLPCDYRLNQNYPNPFNQSTVISFTLAEPVHTVLTIYNMSGQRVTTLIDRKIGAGSHAILFNAKGLASGIYFYQIQAGKFNAVGKMVLIE